jgi:hypothetical protein
MYRLFKPLMQSKLKFRQVSIGTNTSNFHTDRELLALKQNMKDKVAFDKLQNEYKKTGSLHYKLALEKARQKYQNSFDTVIAICKLEEKTPRPK